MLSALKWYKEKLTDKDQVKTPKDSIQYYWIGE